MARPTRWLKTNSRPLLVSMSFPALLLLLGLPCWWLSPTTGWWSILSWLSLIAVVFSLIAIPSLLWLLLVPRLSYRSGFLLVYSDYLVPYPVPIDVVECFFLGNGPSLMAWAGDGEDGPNTNTLVVRLAESQTQWHQKPCRPALGHWCDGYIVLRGTWCEPLTGELLANLNQWLVEAHRQNKEEAATQ